MLAFMQVNVTNLTTCLCSDVLLHAVLSYLTIFGIYTVSECTYVTLCIHYIHTFKHTYIHTYMPTNLHLRTPHPASQSTRQTKRRTDRPTASQTDR